MVRNYERSAGSEAPHIRALLVLISLGDLFDIGVNALSSLGAYGVLARPVGVGTVKHVVISNNLRETVGGGGGRSVKNRGNKSIISIDRSYGGGNGVSLVCSWYNISELWSE
tara:strand:- start:1180 stop:1515 length:336 start_codon:yes stop_codon:yes gene_type:complete